MSRFPSITNFHSIMANRRFAVFIALLIVPWANAGRADETPTVKILRTPGGVKFGILGDKPLSPAPTLFVIALDVQKTLTDPDYNKVGLRLAKQGWLCVALDVPGHGNDNKEKAVDGLIAWRDRMQKGEVVVEPFTKRCSEVLDYLIAEKYTKANRVAASGTSRGAFTQWPPSHP
jgi:hypothetical protein